MLNNKPFFFFQELELERIEIVEKNKDFEILKEELSKKKEECKTEKAKFEEVKREKEIAEKKMKEIIRNLMYVNGHTVFYFMPHTPPTRK
jgi:predicted transcriptional regulator